MSFSLPHHVPVVLRVVAAHVAEGGAHVGAGHGVHVEDVLVRLAEDLGRVRLAARVDALVERAQDDLRGERIKKKKALQLPIRRCGIIE